MHELRAAFASTALALVACGSTQTAGPSATPATPPAAPSDGATPSPTVAKEPKVKSVAAQEYEKECEAGLAQAKAQLAALEKVGPAGTVAAVLVPLNGLWISLDSGTNLAGLYSRVHPDKDVRDVAEACEQKFSQLATEVSLSRPVYEAVVSVVAGQDDLLTQRYLKNLVRDFKRAGVDREAAVRAQVKSLKDELVTIGQDFSKNVREDVRTLVLDSPGELDGLPQDYIDGHKPGADGKIRITTDYPDYVPYMTYAKSDARRLELYKLFRQRGYPKNREVLERMLQKRHSLATLLGYKNWAVYITEDKMIKTADAARTFIEKVVKVSAPRAKRDYEELLSRLKKTDPKAATVGDWQKAFVEELVKKEKYAFDSQALRAYFPYEAVRDGVLGTVSKMFGVRFAKVQDASVWHPSVEPYDVFDGNEKLGRFYLDMHPRPDKYKHAAAFPMRTGVLGQQLPEAALVCNFPGGDGGSPLMEHDQVETFYHEFGHLIHHIFGGKQPWLGVSGFNTEWDFVEAPSQMLEEWAWDPSTLKTFAKNAKGETLPDALIAAMRKARDFGKGLWVEHQMFYASLSLAYYDRDPNGLDTAALAKELQEKYSPFGYVPDTYFELSFGHLDGYSAIYYTYMWSLVIAKDLFSVFTKRGLLDAEAAKRYRTYVLGPGGSKDADVLVKDFLGRPYGFDAFASWLDRS